MEALAEHPVIVSIVNRPIDDETEGIHVTINISIAYSEQLLVTKFSPNNELIVNVTSTKRSDVC